jgi:hypothetical protein
MTKQIELTQGKATLVSDHRYEYLNQWKWLAQRTSSGNYYAVRWSEGGRESRRLILMHRVITNAPDGMDVDHKDRNGLNNTDENLRVCTRSQNMRNRRIRNKTGFVGVSWYKQTNRYRACACLNRKSITIGYFLDPADAARAYDKFAKKHFDEFAQLNFPEAQS